MKKFSKTYSDHSYISATRPTFITYPLTTMIQIWRALNWGRLISSPRCPSEHFSLVTSSHKELFEYKYNSIPRRLFWSTNMDAVSLFWSTYMVEMTSCEICNVLWRGKEENSVNLPSLCSVPKYCNETSTVIKLFWNFTLLYFIYKGNINFNVKNNIQPVSLSFKKDVNYTC